MKTEADLPANFLFFMNKKLPNSIVFLELIPVGQQTHVCIDANSRTYDYLLHDYPDAWLARMSSHIDLENFEPTRCSKVMSDLIQQSDYRQFCLTPDRHNSTIVDVREVTLYRDDSCRRYRFRFVADRFLRGMIRVLVHDLLMVGKGELGCEEFLQLLHGRERGRQVDLAPPQGLYLTGVKYPYIQREPDLPLCGQGNWKAIQ